jgi:diguanylate cyclase (GGDEF)-like protein/PAS domain S-box-containing protein
VRGPDGDDQAHMRRAWLAYLAGGGLLAAGYFFLHALTPLPTAAVRVVVYTLVGLSSVAAILVGVRRHRPASPLVWYLLAAGRLCYVVADVLFFTLQHILHVNHVPTVADAFYLGSYPFVVAGLLLVVRRRSPGGDRAGLIDALIVATGTAVVSWVFLIAPFVGNPDLEVAGQVTSAAYPVADLTVAAVTARLVTGGGGRTAAFGLVGAAVLGTLASDSIYVAMQLSGTYQVGGPLDGGWLLVHLLWGAAALHPSMRRLTEPSATRAAAFRRGRLGLLAGAALMPPAVLAVQAAGGGPTDIPLIVAGWVAVLLLVVARLAGLFNVQEQAVRRERVLREAGADLVTAASPADSETRMLAGVRTLLAGVPAHAAILHRDSKEGFRVAAAEGAAAEEAGGCRLPAGAVERLRRRQTVELRPDEAPELAAALDPGGTCGVLLLDPLVFQGGLRGALAVASVHPLPADLRDALDTLGSQLTLSLESAVLARDLQRRESEARFRSLVQNASDVTMVVGADTVVSYVTPPVQRVLGWEPAELLGVELAELIHPEESAYARAFYADMDGDGESTATVEWRVRHRDGSWRQFEVVNASLLDDDAVRGIVATLRDVTERRELERELEHQAFHDRLTGLANRALFRDRLEHALARRNRNPHPVAVLLLDLDDFKVVNDSLGHAAGDRLLVMVAERLRGHLRASDTTARLGGDEFAVLLDDPASADEATLVAERLVEVLTAPYQLDGRELFVRASIGVALAAVTGQPADELLRDADMAMYAAKAQSRGGYQIFQPALHEAAVGRLALEGDLQRGIEEGQFALHYQPILELASGRLVGLEALLRWHHAERGWVAPLDFIPAAEASGQIVPIGRFVLRQACRQAVAWQARFPAQPLKMSVNVSARQLQEPDVAEDIKRVVDECGMDPRLLVLEITETVLVKDVEAMAAKLRALTACGLRVAVDDFGTGYSSLSYLHRFPVHLLKIDKSFTDRVDGSVDDAALARAIVRLGQALHLETVAEGVETASQLAALRELGCTFGQGYHFAKPMDAGGIEGLLEAGGVYADSGGWRVRS